MLLRCPIQSCLLPALRNARERKSSNLPSERARKGDITENSGSTSRVKSFKSIPGPTVWPIVGNIWEFRKLNMMHKTIQGYMMDYGPGLVKFHIGSTPWVLVADLNLMHELVTNQSKTFVHRGAIDALDFVYSAFFGAPATESGVFFANNSVWKRNRHALMMIMNKPEFRKRSTDIFNSTADELVEQWKNAATSANLVELMGEMIKYSTDAIGQVCYSKNLGAVKGRFVESFIEDVRFLLGFVNTFLYAPMFTLKTMKFLAPVLPFMKKFKYSVENLRIRGEEMLTQRQAMGVDGHKNDLLGHLLQLASMSGESAQLTSQDVNSILFDVVGAGHDSVSNLFAMTLAQLAANPHYQERLYHEIKRYVDERGSNSTHFDEEDLRKLPFLDGVVREALRLYPSGAITIRMATEDTIVGGYHIPSRTQLMLLPYGVQRHPDHWVEPNVFKPERWATEKYRVNNLAYIPFGGGARSCLGGRLATNEAKVIVAKIILNFHLRPTFDPAVDLDSQVQFTLRPASPLPVRIILRN